MSPRIRPSAATVALAAIAVIGLAGTVTTLEMSSSHPAGEAMTQPADPQPSPDPTPTTDPAPTTGPAPDPVPGPPDPVAVDTLQSPAPEVRNPQQPDTDVAPAEPVSEEAALPVDTQLVLNAGGVSMTSFSYLREITGEGIVVHVMITSDGTADLELSGVRLALVTPDGEIEGPALPAAVLAHGQSWEGDVTFPAPGAQLAPGQATIRVTLPGAEPGYASV